MPGVLKVTSANIANLTNEELNTLTALVSQIQVNIQDLQTSVNTFNTTISNLQTTKADASAVQTLRDEFDAIVGGASGNLDTLEGNIENIEQALLVDSDVTFALQS